MPFGRDVALSGSRPGSASGREQARVVGPNRRQWCRETQVSGFLRGYKGEPSVEAILGVTDRLPAGDPVPESP